MTFDPKKEVVLTLVASILQADRFDADIRVIFAVFPNIVCIVAFDNEPELEYTLAAYTFEALTLLQASVTI
jgi:hypothetical protein